MMIAPDEMAGERSRSSSFDSHLPKLPLSRPSALTSLKCGSYNIFWLNPLFPHGASHGCVTTL